MRTYIRMMLSLGVLLGLALNAGAQSPSYNSGQPVAPAYEGWEEGADGVKYFLFGYMNRNWEEELDVPVGPENASARAQRTSASRRISCRDATASSSRSPCRRTLPRKTNWCGR